MKIEKIHKLEYEDIQKIPYDERVEWLLEGLEDDKFYGACEGYRFGTEVEFRNFCISLDKTALTVFKSSHAGFIAPNFLEIDDSHKDFKIIFDKTIRAIKNGHKKMAEETIKKIKET